MKNKVVTTTAVLLLPCFILVSCLKNQTKYFADEQDKGLTIFSNTGDNIFSCYINDMPWRTVNRRTGGFLIGPRSEIHLYKEPDSTMGTTLVIEWDGNFTNDPNNFDRITLHLAVPAGFSNHDLNNFEEKRITIDSTNGYFTMNVSGINTNAKGTGNIYFNKASVKPTGQDISGMLSGLLEADFPGAKITKGRFDHQLTYVQVEF